MLMALHSSKGMDSTGPRRCPRADGRILGVLHVCTVELYSVVGKMGICTKVGGTGNHYFKWDGARLRETMHMYLQVEENGGEGQETRKRPRRLRQL